MRFAKSEAAALIAWGLLFGPPVEADVSFVQESTWELRGTPSEDRWLEFHQVESAGANVIIHISVLSRRKGRPVWETKHIIPHMAITQAALRKSGIIPAPKIHMSYPETYSEGYRHWRELRAQGNAPICETSVLDCAHLLP
jgi:hypothetical protein